jgi:hypothetical protein
MLVLLIVLAVVIVLAMLIGFGGFGGYGPGYGGPGGPTVYRRIIYRRPARRVVTEHRVVDAGPIDDPIDGPAYRA